MGQAFKKAFGFQSLSVEISSFTDCFYQHIFDKAGVKYESPPCGYFKIDSSDFLKFLKHVGEKYKIKY